MSLIGDQLRAAREARGCSLDEVERHTRIRSQLLAALEAGDLSAFASPAQARGFLRIYAEFLGLNVDARLAGLSAPGATRPRPPQPGRVTARPAPAPGQPRVQGGWRRIVTRDLFIGVSFTLLFGLLLGWGAVQLWQAAAAPATGVPAALISPQASTAATPDGLGGSATVGGVALAVTEPPDSSATTPIAPLPSPLPNYVGVNVLVRAEQRTWLRAVVDGAEAFAGQMAPSSTREFVGNNVVELWTGNGQGTRVVFNGQDQGVLGGLGEVVIRLWTLSGPVTPTPTPTATQ